MTLLDDARAWFDALAPAPEAWLAAQRARVVRWQWFDGEVGDPEPLRTALRGARPGRPTPTASVLHHGFDADDRLVWREAIDGAATIWAQQPPAIAVATTDPSGRVTGVGLLHAPRGDVEAAAWVWRDGSTRAHVYHRTAGVVTAVTQTGTDAQGDPWVEEVHLPDPAGPAPADPGAAGGALVGVIARAVRERVAELPEAPVVVALWLADPDGPHPLPPHLAVASADLLDALGDARWAPASWPALRRVQLSPARAEALAAANHDAWLQRRADALQALVAEVAAVVATTGGQEGGPFWWAAPHGGPVSAASVRAQLPDDLRARWAARGWLSGRSTDTDPR